MDTKIKEKKVDEPYQKRPVLFEYPALPGLEMSFYWTVVICSSVYAWYRIYVASRSFDWDGYDAMDNCDDVEWPMGLGPYRKDTSEFEWGLWTIYAKKALPWFIGHCLLFNWAYRIMPRSIWALIMLIYWILAHVMVANGLVVGVTVVQGLVIYALARVTKAKWLVWSVGLVMLYFTTARDYLVIYDSDGYGYYVNVIVLPYKMVQYLTYTTEMIKIDKFQDSFLSGLYDMFWYAFYFPYSSYLIFTYKRFPVQMAERDTKKCRNWNEIIKFGLRIAFWCLVGELIFYVCYFEAMMTNPGYLKSITEDTLVAIGMATGQFFHLKYVVIFGVPAFFARLDNMQPWEGPICISRVTMYSKIWRYFDRGLYDFFKEYIFLPICRPTFSIGRKISGVLVSYAFVLLWHGTERQYIVWVVLNIVGLILETIAKIIYTIPKIRKFRESYISDRNFRRILAWLQIVTFAFGLYSNFYFLGGAESGYVFVDRIFWRETVPINWPFILLISLGYCFSHVCMEIDRWQGDAKRKIEEDKKK